MGTSGPLERAQLANQIQGLRVPDRSDAWENNKKKVFRELKITTDIMNIGPYATASLSFKGTWNQFSSTGRYLKDKLLIKGFFFFFLPNKLLNSHVCFPVSQFLK